MPLNMRTTSMPRAQLPLLSTETAQHDQAWLPVREARARAREADMWDPAAFHPAQPSTFHRTPDQARDDPPPKKGEVMCYVYHAQLREHATTGIVLATTGIVLAPNLHLLKAEQQPHSKELKATI